MRAKFYAWWPIGLALISLSSLPFLDQQPNPPVPSATSATSPTSSVSSVARIPFELNGNNIFFQGRVNNSAPLWLSLDTGASSGLLNLRIVRTLGLSVVRGSQATGAGGTVEAVTLSNVTININGARLEDLALQAVPLNSIEDSTGRVMDGIVGAELFRRYVVEIDYADKVITLYEPASYEYRGPGESLPLTFSDNHPYVRAEITMPGREPIAGEFVIDAGSNFPVILLKSFVESQQLTKSLPPTLPVVGRGVGGEIPLPVGRVPQLQLGRFTLSNLIAAFPSRGIFAREGAAGNIGGGILRRFKVIFDYSRQRMILEPNKHFAEPYEYDMSGISLMSESPDFRNIKVLRILESSPASELGIESDDLLVAIDGRPALEIGLRDIREMFKRGGRVYRLEIKRGRESLLFKLETRRLI